MPCPCSAADRTASRGTRRCAAPWNGATTCSPSAEQVLLRRLSVFSGGFTLDALEAVCARPARSSRANCSTCWPSWWTSRWWSPRRRPPGPDTGNWRRSASSASENLDQAGEAAQLAAAHCAYFLAFAGPHNPERATGVVIEQPKLLDREHDNLRAALRWSCAHDPETALRLAASLWRFWFLRGHAVEGARWVERALAVAPDPTRPRAAALIGLTGLDSRQGRGDRHRALGAEALAIIRRDRQPRRGGRWPGSLRPRSPGAPSTWTRPNSWQPTCTPRHSRAADPNMRPPAVGCSASARCPGRTDRSPPGTFNTCLSELAQSDTSTRPFLPVITPSLQLVPIAGRLVPCVEETLLLGRRVGVIQANGYVLSAIGYAARLVGDPQSADLRRRGCGRTVRRAEATTWPGRRHCTSWAASTATAATTARPVRPCPWRGSSASDSATAAASC